MYYGYNGSCGASRNFNDRIFYGPPKFEIITKTTPPKLIKAEIRRWPTKHQKTDHTLILVTKKHVFWHFPKLDQKTSVFNRMNPTVRNLVAPRTRTFQSYSSEPCEQVSNKKSYRLWSSFCSTAIFFASHGLNFYKILHLTLFSHRSKCINLTMVHAGPAEIPKTEYSTVLENSK